MSGNETTKLSDAIKEKIKLQATFINGLAIGVLLIGTFTPITRVAYDPTVRPEAFVSMVLTAIICFMLGFVLHYYASRHLKGLDQ
ncbi:hypothetical protein [Phyllobacterium leguminum]|uniref:Uncharacterized protein n=1 Tax=Phyllobacterium leguminum TaxID=314237 RepID=A0A318T754_9HYPH|nr:hypothetical protein [Phyllobacterium leguminum]PYE90393.1 hypothetical protein C7477_10165 [Phyllobacterium leguminum]